jgi:hypothetical protein
VLYLNEWSNLKELPSSISQLKCTLKPWFMGVFQLERTTFIYWPIECTLKTSFVKVFQLLYWYIVQNIFQFGGQLPNIPNINNVSKLNTQLCW